MSFETIKTIKGHKYGYTVESYREDGKTKQRILKYHGRVDKEPTPTSGIDIPDGFYYFSAEGCDGCMPEENLRGVLEPYILRGLKITIQYINMSKTGGNPTPIEITGTPTLIDVCGGKLWVGVSNSALPHYLAYKLGGKNYEEISKAVAEERTRADIKKMLKVIFTEKTKGGHSVGKRQRNRIHKKYPDFPQEEISRLFTEVDIETPMIPARCKDDVCTTSNTKVTTT
jgi:hypothetical protein